MESVQKARALLSPPFVPPSYTIGFANDGTLLWDPPVGSQELALVLSYHFPLQRTLAEKMQAAIGLWLKEQRKAKLLPAHDSRDSQNSSGISARASEISYARSPPVTQADWSLSAESVFLPGNSLPAHKRATERAKAQNRKGQTAPAIQAGVPGTTSWRVEGTNFLHSRRKKRVYTDAERKQVGQNRGNVCEFHRLKKLKCDPNTCSRNKLRVDGQAKSSKLRVLEKNLTGSETPFLVNETLDVTNSSIADTLSAGNSMSIFSSQSPRSNVDSHSLQATPNSNKNVDSSAGDSQSPHTVENATAPSHRILSAKYVLTPGDLSFFKYQDRHIDTDLENVLSQSKQELALDMERPGFLNTKALPLFGDQWTEQFVLPDQFQIPRISSFEDPLMFTTMDFSEESNWINNFSHSPTLRSASPNAPDLGDLTKPFSMTDVTESREQDYAYPLPIPITLDVSEQSSSGLTSMSPHAPMEGTLQNPVANVDVGPSRTELFQDDTRIVPQQVWRKEMSFGATSPLRTMGESHSSWTSEKRSSLPKLHEKPPDFFQHVQIAKEDKHLQLPKGNNTLQENKKSFPTTSGVSTRLSSATLPFGKTLTPDHILPGVFKRSGPYMRYQDMPDLEQTVIQQPQPSHNLPITSMTELEFAGRDRRSQPKSSYAQPAPPPNFAMAPSSPSLPSIPLLLVEPPEQLTSPSPTLTNLSSERKIENNLHSSTDSNISSLQTSLGYRATPLQPGISISPPPGSVHQTKAGSLTSKFGSSGANFNFKRISGPEQPNQEPRSMRRSSSGAKGSFSSSRVSESPQTAKSATVAQKLKTSAPLNTLIGAQYSAVEEKIKVHRRLENAPDPSGSYQKTQTGDQSTTSPVLASGTVPVLENSETGGSANEPASSRSRRQILFEKETTTSTPSIPGALNASFTGFAHAEPTNFSDGSQAHPRPKPKPSKQGPVASSGYIRLAATEQSSDTVSKQKVSDARSHLRPSGILGLLSKKKKQPATQIDSQISRSRPDVQIVESGKNSNSLSTAPVSRPSNRGQGHPESKDDPQKFRKQSTVEPRATHSKVNENLRYDISSDTSIKDTAMVQSNDHLLHEEQKEDREYEAEDGKASVVNEYLVDDEDTMHGEVDFDVISNAGKTSEALNDASEAGEGIRHDEEPDVGEAVPEYAKDVEEAKARKPFSSDTNLEADGNFWEPQSSVMMFPAARGMENGRTSTEQGRGHKEGELDGLRTEAETSEDLNREDVTLLLDWLTLSDDKAL